MVLLTPRSTAFFLALALFSSSFTDKVSAGNTPEADKDWQIVLEQATGPGVRFSTQEEAFRAAAQHLSKQEVTLRDFWSHYPDDTRSYSAQIRLAAVMSAEGRLRHDSALMSEASKLLGGLENGQDIPLLVKADAGFARVSQVMEDVASHPDSNARASLLETVRQFNASYPGDRRIGNLFTEVATLYDSLPDQKKALLEEALKRTKDEAAKQRIGDDLKRITFLGHPVDIRLQPVDGSAPVDLAQHHGRVQVILFWASYSLPALQELAALQKVAARFVGEPVDFWTASLDEDRAALEGTIKVADLKWPTHFDGRGWQGELVRSLGINALPTVWVLDRQGRLLTLNARGDEADTIRRAIVEP